MALRLTDSPLAEPASSPAPAPAPTPASPASSPASPPAWRRFATRAAERLAAGDLRGYRSLFAQAGEEPDANLRYASWLRLCEQGLAAAGAADPAPANAGDPAPAAKLFAAVAEGAVAALEAEPREPVLLNYAGVALYELWSLDAARALFLAARRLDPGLPHLEGNLVELGRRRKAARQGGRPIRPPLGELERRARRVAELARPAAGQRLSLCMIVRDEEEMLPRCLEAAAPAVDEIVVVDTGSVDRTIEIALSFGAHVIERPWTGSFADARNASFDAATGDWVLYLDADEVLVADDVGRLRELITRTWREAFYLVETNYTGGADDGSAVTHNALRLFRNRPQYRFEGRLHEQIAQHLPAYVPERIECSSVRVEHYGYLGVVRDAKEKSRRNIELLLAQRAESPPTAFLHFNLGSEYAAAGDAPTALAEFERAWELVRRGRETGVPDPEFTPILVVRLVKALRYCGRCEDALRCAEEGLASFPGFTDLVYEQATAAATLGRIDEAAAHLERCISMGDAPAAYTATRGCGTYLPRLALAELHLRAGEFERALALLQWCVDEHPAFYGVVLPYATTLLRTGAAPEAVVSAVQSAVPKLTPTVRFMLATALYEAGAVPDAAGQFALVLAEQPHSGPALVALAEAQLAQKRYGEAAETAAAISPEDPLAAAALRSELFGRIVAGDGDGADAALARAEAAGLPGVEREVFGGWLALARGARPVATLAGEAAGVMELILEALLRVHEFKAFETLHALFEDIPVPARERRELLGNLYLRRGFLASAAQEWMAVCQEQADPRALVGLAKVAAAHGLPADAATFAREALALEPANEAARWLLEQVAQAA